VLGLTEGRGVDLVFDGVGGEVTRKSALCLARFGRLAMIGFASGIEAEDLPLTVMPRTILFASITLIGVMLAYVGDPRYENPAPGIHLLPRAIGERVQRSLEALLAEGRIRPMIGEVVGFEELPAALDRMDQRLTTGRTIVTF
jgi:NADPH2:quinone reductase